MIELRFIDMTLLTLEISLAIEDELQLGVQRTVFYYFTRGGLAQKDQACSRLLTILCSSPLDFAAFSKNTIVFLIATGFQSSALFKRNSVFTSFLKVYRAGDEY